MRAVFSWPYDWGEVLLCFGGFDSLCQALERFDHLFFDEMEIVEVLVEVEKSQMYRLVATRQRFGQNLFVQAIGFANAAPQIYTLDSSLEIALGYVDEKLWRSNRAFVDAVHDAQGINDKGATLGKQPVNGGSAT